MKFFTRYSFLLAVLLVPLAPTFAKIVTVTIGNNFYSPMKVEIASGDEISFVWQAGFHPTVSDSPTSLWAPFTLSKSDPARTIKFTTIGVYPYHCEAHGSPSNGQHGVIEVKTGTPTAPVNPSLAVAVLNVFPNPSRGQLTVQLNQKPGVAYKLRLSNIIGQEVRTIALKPELTSAGLPLDLSDLPTGMYFYSLLADGKVMTTKRLVLQN